MKCLQYIALCICLLLAGKSFAQIGYQKDSLQIKVYTEIEYRDGLIKEIKADKVFCDYCTVFQIERIKEEAIRRTYIVGKEEENGITNGKYKQALYIRISKKDFLEMKKDTINN